VDTIFGLPGDGIKGIMEALRKRREQIRFILTSFARLSLETAAVPRFVPGARHVAYSGLTLPRVLNYDRPSPSYRRAVIGSTQVARSAVR
jgi:hypothetical protein